MQTETATDETRRGAAAAFPDRRIYPPWPKRVAFLALGCAAVAARILTWPRRALGTKRRDAALVFEPFGMGDALLLQPLVRALLASGKRVAFAGNPAWAPLFPAAEGFAFVPARPDWASPDPARKYRGPVRDILHAARVLRPFAKRAECIEPRGDPRAILALWLAGASTVRSLPLYWSATDCRLPPFVARFVPFDRRATRREVSRAFAPPDVPYGRPDLAHLLGDAPHPDPKTVGLIPLTPWEGKRWPPEHWRALAADLRARGFSPALLCGPGEAEAARRAAGVSLGEPAPHGSADSACEATPLRVLEAASAADWPRLLAACGAVVSVNTGPMHIADALDIPLVVLDGASRLPLWAPEGPRSAVLQHQERAPEAPPHPTASNGPAVQRAVMALVTPEEVLAVPFLRAPGADVPLAEPNGIG